MSANAKKYKLFILSSLAVALIMSVARLIIIVNNIEVSSLTDVNGLYYIEGTNAPVVFAVLCGVVALALFVGSVVFTGKLKCCENFESPAVSFASAILGLILFTLVVYYVFFATIREFDYTSGFWIILVLSVISAAYFLCLSSRRAREKLGFMLPLFSMMPVFLTAARLLVNFIAHNLTVNASSYSYHFLGLAVLMLFFCCEGRFTVGYRRKRIYVALALISALLLSIYCIPALYLSLFWPLGFTDTTVYCLADFVAVIYIYCRLFAFPKKECVASNEVTAAE